MAKSSEPHLQVQGVTYCYGNTAALTDINLTLYPGERVALIGPSGAGKSTLLKLLNGTLTPTTGTVSVLGVPLADPNPRRRRALQQQIGTVYQQFHLVENLRVIHNVNAGQLGRWPWYQALWSLVWPQGIETARQALARVGLPDKLYSRTDRLSGGEQQRVAIARILVQDPAILLADEPISNLDPARSHEVMTLLTHCGQGKTLIMSLHALEFAQTYCERLVGLREGKIFFDGLVTAITPQQITQLYRLEP
ncbi:phosphonate ABC transporter ATP-binding protein [Candidatus Cyanaurora vandensis]|uniref:phosphonate ABC transporter ATP-binding protein n=1 Tax=Candidatus Cyanaurora vandensis TaxID=2714958 RepID=UPI00257D017F|nr:phosphonate ABC transporter ATP-binding protein [Candidatus Cyanaurora vandensis]